MKEIFLTLHDQVSGDKYPLGIEDLRHPKVFRIWRQTDNDLVVHKMYMGVSRYHAKIVSREGIITLIDDSSNGTIIENLEGESKTIRGCAEELHPGDRISLPDYGLVVVEFED